MNFIEWKAFLLSADHTDRSHAADELPDDGSDEEVESLLIDALQDEDALVRACAADSLKAFDTETSRNSVRLRLDVENDPVAKGFAVSTLGSIGNFSDLARISRLFEDSRSDQRVREHCASAAIELVLRTCLDHLIERSDVAGTGSEESLQGAVNLLADTAEQIKDGINRIADWSQHHSSSGALPTYQESLRRLEKIRQ